MFKGTYTALITPFASSGEVDYEGFRSNLCRQKSGGVTGVVVLGTTGEPATLTDDEQVKLTELAVAELRGKAKVIAGAGSNSTRESIALAQRAERLGADAVLVVTPYYNRPSDEGVFLHFKAVAESVSIPVIVYNIQSRTGKNIDPNLMERIASIPNIVGDKEASGSAAQCGEIIERIGRTGKFCVLSGDDGLTLPFLSLGAKGLISVISNAIPETTVRFVNLCLAGDYASARELHHDIIMPMTRLAFSDSSPVPIKYICGKLGLAGGGVRLPLCAMDGKKQVAIDEGLRALKLIP